MCVPVAAPAAAAVVVSLSMPLLWMMVCCMSSINHQHWVSCSCCSSWLCSVCSGGGSTPSAEATNDLWMQREERQGISKTHWLLATQRSYNFGSASRHFRLTRALNQSPGLSSSLALAQDQNNLGRWVVLEVVVVVCVCLGGSGSGSGSCFSSSRRPFSPSVSLLSPIPYVGGRKVRRVLAGSYLGRTERSKLAVLGGYLDVRRQRVRWYHLEGRKGSSKSTSSLKMEKCKPKRLMDLMGIRSPDDWSCCGPGVGPPLPDWRRHSWAPPATQRPWGGGKCRPGRRYPAATRRPPLWRTATRPAVCRPGDGDGRDCDGADAEPRAGAERPR